MAIEGTVKTPFGPVQKKTAIVAGGGLAVLLGVAWYRHKQSGGTTTGTSPNSLPGTAGIASGASGDPYPPDGTSGDSTDLNSTDPATGMTYGDEQAGYTGAGYGYPGYPGPTPGSGGGGSGSPPSGGFTSNAQWAQAAEAYMGSDGHDPIAGALGKYLAGGQLDATQQQSVQEAIAAEGQPPVAGPGGYPPNIHLAPGGHGGGGPGRVKNPVSGLRVADRAANSVDLTWTPSRGASGYRITATPTTRGKARTIATTVTGPKARVAGLDRSTHYTLTVHANPDPGGTRDATVTATTTK